MWLNFNKNDLMPDIKAKYLDRDYKLQFNLMADWWLKNRKKLPKAISAFSNWLDKTKPDEAIITARNDEWEKKKTEELISPYAKDLSGKMKSV